MRVAFVCGNREVSGNREKPPDAAIPLGIANVLGPCKDEFPFWIIPSLGLNFDAGLFRRLRRGGFHGPLWQHIRTPLRASSPDAPVAAPTISL